MKSIQILSVIILLASCAEEPESVQPAAPQLPIPTQELKTTSASSGRALTDQWYWEKFECSQFADPFNPSPYFANDIVNMDLNGPIVEWRLSKAKIFFWRETIFDEPAHEGSAKALRIQKGGYGMMNFYYNAGRDVKISFLVQRQREFYLSNTIEHFDIWICKNGNWMLFKDNLTAETNLKLYEFDVPYPYNGNIAVAFRAEAGNQWDVDIKNLVIQ